MKIPDKYQIFPRPIILIDKDAGRLSPFLSGWERLHAVLATMQEPDIERLIVIEMMYRRRPMIIDRLASRLMQVAKIRIRAKIRKAIR
jgi:hypothetical protein